MRHLSHAPPTLRFFFALLLTAALCAVGIWPAASAQAQGDPIYVSSDIESDQTWTASEGPYVIQGSVTIAEDVTLTMDPGVVVKFQSSGSDLFVEGALFAEGTVQDSVIFTSIKDDTHGGDTNGDGAATIPAPEDWETILFRAGSSGSLDHAVVLYGGDPLNFGSLEASALIYVRGSSPTITNSRLAFSYWHGIEIEEGGSETTPLIEGNVFAENGRSGVFVNDAGATITDNVFVSNGQGAAQIRQSSDQISSPVTIAGNTGSANGINGIRWGGETQDALRWQLNDGLPYVSSIRVRNEGALTIDPGVVVKFVGGDLKIDGGAQLEANGTSESPVVFTSIKNDNHGGDTNGDGMESTPAPGDWQGIWIRPGANASLDHAVVSYGSEIHRPILSGGDILGALVIKGASASVTSSTFHHNQFAGMQVLSEDDEEADALIENNVFADNGNSGVSIVRAGADVIGNTFTGNDRAADVRMDDDQVNPAPVVEGNSGSDNNTNGIRWSGNLRGVARWHLNEGLPYVSTVRVREGATLTIDPGVVVKFPGGDLKVEGTLQAEGATQDSVTFTSIKDDTHGGDTNGDGMESTPAPGDWQGIWIRPGANASLDHAVVSYGSEIHRPILSGGDIFGALVVKGASASIANSSFRQNQYNGIQVGTEDEEETDALISGAHFEDNGSSGIRIRNASATVRESSIEGNDTGISILGNSVVDLGTTSEDGLNIIRGNENFDVRNSTSSSIPAVGNFWGLTDASAIDERIFDDDERSSSGPVVFEPFLNEEPDIDDPAEPIIASVEPDPVVGSDGAQPFTIQGSGFEAGANVTLRDLTAGETFPNRGIESLTSTEIVINPVFTTEPATWSVEVINPGGESSGEFEFEVVAPGEAPYSISLSADRITPLTVETPLPERTGEAYLEALRNTQTSQDRVVLRARVELREGAIQSVQDLEVQATYKGIPMQVRMSGQVDSEGDGRIDRIPLDANGRQDLPFADVLIVSPDRYPSGTEGEVEVTVSSMQHSATARETLEMHYATSPEGSPFSITRDAYSFDNYSDLTYEDFLEIMSPDSNPEFSDLGIGAGLLTVGFRAWATWNGVCFGMSGTAEQYFLDPSSKPYDSEVFSYEEDDPVVRTRIWRAFISQAFQGTNFELDEANVPAEYEAVESALAENRPALIGMEARSGARHAVSVTKTTVLREASKAYMELYDSNLPQVTVDASYDIGSDDFEYYYDLPLEVSDDEPFLLRTGDYFKFVRAETPESRPLDVLLRDYAIKFYRERAAQNGKIFSAFLRSGEAAQSQRTAIENHNSSSTGENFFSLLVTNSQGQRAGHLRDGALVNEIPGARVERIALGGASADSITYVLAPADGAYSASMNGFADGLVRFEHYRPGEEEVPEVAFADSVDFTTGTAAIFDETDPAGNLLVDRDGDGEVDEAIPLRSGLLPVELTAFDATAERESVLLTWQTASETRNSGFSIERKVGEAAQWTEIGFREGAGTTTEAQTYRFEDANVPYEAERLTYRLKQVDLDGAFTYSEEVEVGVGTPEAFALHGNFPNPFRETTTIRYELPRPAQVRLAVYDVLGRRMAVLIDKEQTAGRKEIQFAAEGLASGTYFVRLEAGDRALTETVVLVR